MTDEQCLYVAVMAAIVWAALLWYLISTAPDEDAEYDAWIKSLRELDEHNAEQFKQQYLKQFKQSYKE